MSRIWWNTIRCQKCTWTWTRTKCWICISKEYCPTTCTHLCCWWTCILYLYRWRWCTCCSSYTSTTIWLGNCPLKCFCSWRLRSSAFNAHSETIPTRNILMLRNSIWTWTSYRNIRQLCWSKASRATWRVQGAWINVSTANRLWDLKNGVPVSGNYCGASSECQVRGWWWTADLSNVVCTDWLTLSHLPNEIWWPIA